MDDDDDAPPKQQPSAVNTVMGPIYLMWENSIEKLKILNYERDFCKKLNKKPFSRVQFVIPGTNASHQFNEFIDICQWLCTEITRKPDTFKPEEFDDPNTIVNKLMLALRQLDFRSSFPPQKLKVAHGEATCSVVEFLTDKALSERGFQFQAPVYANNEEIEQAEADDDDDDDEIIDDDAGGGIDEDIQFEEASMSMRDNSLDQSQHNILQALVDPVEWKTELERVGPKLRANQHVGTNEWRSHVDQTVTSKGQIEKVLGDTQGDLQSMNKAVADELNKMRMKEKYLNNQYNSLGLEFIEVKHKLEELEKKGTSAHESVARLTNELAEVSEKLDDLKESFESKDSGLHDTSPLVKIKSALQQIKAEIHSFDMRIGVVSHSLLSARVQDNNRLRSQAVSKARRRHNKARRDSDDNSLLSDDA